MSDTTDQAQLADLGIWNTEESDTVLCSEKEKWFSVPTLHSTAQHRLRCLLCTALVCTALHCTVLYWCALVCIPSKVWSGLQPSPLYKSAMYFSLHSIYLIALQYFQCSVHCILYTAPCALCYSALHCTVAHTLCTYCTHSCSVFPYILHTVLLHCYYGVFYRPSPCPRQGMG